MRLALLVVAIMVYCGVAMAFVEAAGRHGETPREADFIGITWPFVAGYEAGRIALDFIDDYHAEVEP